MFLSLMATGALWYQNTKTLENHIAEYKKDIANLREENRELNEKYIDVLTELRSLK